MKMHEPKPRHTMPQAGDSTDTIRNFIATAHTVDLADWLATLPSEESLHVLRELVLSRRADTFSRLPLETQATLARDIKPRHLARIVTEMSADDRVDLFNTLNPEEQQRLSHDLAPEAREDIRQLSAYAEETAGAIMTSGYATLAASISADEAIEALRRAAPKAETIYRSYVIDADCKLLGSIRLQELILAASDTPIADIMDADPISTALETDQEEVARLISRYNLSALPVVDANGKLLGIITRDDAEVALRHETTEDFQKIATVQPFSQSMRKASMSVLYRKRIFWLSLLVFGNLFSGAGIAYFEETILAYVSLVFFLPLLIDSGGNAGSQAATLMVRALATGDVVLKDWRDLILREFAIAAALGATMAVMVSPIGWMRGGADIAIVVGLTMVLVVMVGSLVGMSLPFLLSRLKLDPATASAPLVTTISDGVGVLIYFSIATFVLL